MRRSLEHTSQEENQLVFDSMEISKFVKGEIVGVVTSIKHTSLELDAEPALYVSYQQSSTFPIMNFVVKTTD